MRLCFALVGWHGGRDACLPCSTRDGLRDEAEWGASHPTNLPTYPFFFLGGRFLLLSMRAMCNKKKINCAVEGVVVMIGGKGRVSGRGVGNAYLQTR